jgi:hypothetical protein
MVAASFLLQCSLSKSSVVRRGRVKLGKMVLKGGSCDEKGD